MSTVAVVLSYSFMMAALVRVSLVSCHVSWVLRSKALRMQRGTSPLGGPAICGWYMRGPWPKLVLRVLRWLLTSWVRVLAKGLVRFNSVSPGPSVPFSCQVDV